MSHVFRTKLQFTGCPHDAETSKLFDSLSQAMLKQDGAYTASFGLDVRFKDGTAAVKNKNTVGLNADHTKMLSALEETVLKAVAKGGDPAKIKVETQVEKD